MTLPLSQNNTCNGINKTANTEHFTLENKGKSMTSDENYDIYRDSLLRYLGYTNEVGEAFRSLVPKVYVYGSYVVASSYVMADAFHKYQTTKKQLEVVKKSDKPVANSKQPQFSPIASGFDALIWQSLASVIIPGFTINRLCAGSLFAMQKVSRKSSISFQKWTVTAIGLLAIPFIIRPIDEAVHILMDSSVRKFYKKPKED